MQSERPEDKGLTNKGKPRQRSRSRVFNESEVEAIIQRYESGESARSIAPDYQTNHKWILKLVKDYGENTRNKSEQAGGLDPALWSEVTDAYIEGASATELAERYKVSIAHIFKIIRRTLGGKVRDQDWYRNRQIPLSPEQEDQVISLYHQRKTTREIAEKLGVPRSQVKSSLARQQLSNVARYSNTPEFSRLGGKRVSADEKKAIQQRLVEAYQQGLSLEAAGAPFGISATTVHDTLTRLDFQTRTPKEARALVPNKVNPETRKKMVEEYQNGYTTIVIGQRYSVAAWTVQRIIQEEGVDIRSHGTFGDSVQDAICNTGRFEWKDRECWLYVFTLNGFDHLKVGISYNIDERKDEVYGDEIFSVLLESRRAALFLEQAVLELTAEQADSPRELVDERWIGVTELLLIPQDELLGLIQWLLGELEELGVWRFAADYVPMTSDQKLQCLSKALDERS